MSSLPTWTSWVIVVACPLLGPMIAFLVVLPVAVLDRWISGAKASSGPSGARAGPFRTDWSRLRWDCRRRDNSDRDGG